MTPPTQNTTAVSTTAAATGLQWSSPIPYLFGGLALVLILIAFALIILACSFKKPYSSSSDSIENDASDQDKPSVPQFRVEIPEEMEQKLVIVMPGDINPTYLAKPAPPTSVDHL
ncbi:hypothetical protein M8C21_008359 [Ambrosia artemisiifolia]|uniref:Uncharacterized protein n=1 Tax=Ambrosia artemisiifolia TaxID=4212 RepID=A0AAD5BQQ9_AMBAR|nr:hypothetical protein M8C21_008359 [Ambrosia artemisiifolia]